MLLTKQGFHFLTSSRLTPSIAILPQSAQPLQRPIENPWHVGVTQPPLWLIHPPNLPFIGNGGIKGENEHPSPHALATVADPWGSVASEHQPCSGLGKERLFVLLIEEHSCPAGEPLQTA